MLVLEFRLRKNLEPQVKYKQKVIYRATEVEKVTCGKRASWAACTQEASYRGTRRALGA